MSFKELMDITRDSGLCTEGNLFEVKQNFNDGTDYSLAWQQFRKCLADDRKFWRWIRHQYVNGIPTPLPHCIPHVNVSLTSEGVRNCFRLFPELLEAAQRSIGQRPTQEQVAARAARYKSGQPAGVYQDSRSGGSRTYLVPEPEFSNVPELDDWTVGVDEEEEGAWQEQCAREADQILSEALRMYQQQLGVTRALQQTGRAKKRGAEAAAAQQQPQLAVQGQGGAPAAAAEGGPGRRAKKATERAKKRGAEAAAAQQQLAGQGQGGAPAAAVAGGRGKRAKKATVEAVL